MFAHVIGYVQLHGAIHWKVCIMGISREDIAFRKLAKKGSNTSNRTRSPSNNNLTIASITCIFKGITV